MNSFKVGDNVYVKGGDWEGLTGILVSVEGPTCIVALGIEAIDISDLEIIVKYTDLKHYES